MRTFIAIELPSEIREYLVKIQTETKKYCRRGNYTPAENLHLTLRFLGEVDPSDKEYIREAMFEAAGRIHAFDLRLDKIGFFGRGERGILWAGLGKSDPLQKAFYALEKSLERQGFSRDKKGLSPHITLGREVEPQRSFSDVQKGVRVENLSFSVEKITLMESVRKGPKLIYKPIYTQLLKNKRKQNFQEDE